MESTPEKDIILKIVAQYGNGMASIEDMEQWLKEYANKKLKEQSEQYEIKLLAWHKAFGDFCETITNNLKNK